MKKVKKIFKQGLTFALAFVSTISLFSCSFGKQESSGSNGVENADSNWVENISPTGEYLLKQGKSDYKIVYSESANADEKLAASELQRYFEEGTGKVLPIITDNQVSTYNESSKYIFVGETDFSREENIVLDKYKYGRSGYVIQTVDDSIFLTGAYSSGTVLATYQFLNYILDYDYFYEGIYSLNKNVVDIELMDYEVSIIYDIDLSQMRYGFNNNRTARLKYSNVFGETTAVGGKTGHASMGYLPTDKYLNPDDTENYHPDWYMSDHNPDQLCFTAHGDAEEYDLMVKTAAKVITDIFESNPDAYVFDCSMADNRSWCNCDACKAKILKYGADSVTMVHFLNDMTDTINAWFETEEGKPYKRDYTIVFYAYFSLVTAPVSYNMDDDTFSILDDSVYVNDNVMPKIASVEYDITQSMYSEVNRDTLLAFRAWGKISNNVGGYFYSARYANYIIPIESFNDMQELYTFLYENGVKSLTDLGAGAETGFASGFCALKIYLSAKLCRKVDIDFNAHINKFFDNVYLDASETMKQIFEEWRYLDAYNTALYPEYAGKWSYKVNIAREKYFPLSTLQHWQDLFEQALQEIEHLKVENEAQYKLAYKMIVGERVFVNYLTYRIYEFSLSSSELTALKADLVSDINTAGVAMLSEDPRKSINELLDELQK